MPDWQSEIRKRIASLHLPPVREDEIVEELAQHLDDRYADLLAGGLTHEEAFQSAITELLHDDLPASLGRVERPFQAGSTASSGPERDKFMAGILLDVRYAARILTKQPGFSALVVLTLALGIGANTALFSLVNGVLLKPLPYPQPDQLVTLHQSKPNFETGAIPYPNFRDLQKENQSFSSMAISRGYAYSLIGKGDAVRVNGRLVSADFFSVLGINPFLGRFFRPGEDEPGAEPVAVISADLWRLKFDGAADVVGQSLTLDNKNYLIIGVIPPGFSLVRNVDVYVPIGQWNNPALRSRSAALGLHGIGRLKPGVTIAQAQSDLDRIMRNLAVAYPETNRDNGAKIISLKEGLIGDSRPILWTLLGAVAFVLLIACVNVSNLMLARSTGRARDFAIRAALGAGRWRLLRQSIFESLLLALTGGGIALLLTGWGTKAALGMLPATLPRAEEATIDSRVLLFTIAISLFTGIISGLAPALKTSRSGLSETLKEGGRGSSSPGTRAQGLFVAVEMALAVVLLIGAGLMMRTLVALWKVDPGFRADNVLIFGLNLPPSLQNAKPDAVRNALRDLSDRLTAIPGIQAASLLAGGVPLQGEDDLFFWIEGKAKPASQSEMHMALVYRVEPGYLSAMSIPLKRGRFFSDRDDQRTQPVVVIDEVFAHKYFGDEDPIGKKIHQEGQEPQEIVGVVGHVKQWSIDADETQTLQAQLYEPFRQLPDSSLPTGVGVLMRWNGPSAMTGTAMFDSIRQVVQGQHSQNVIFRPQTMNEVIADTLSARRFSLILLEAFALVALLLASLGLYGVISYLVGQRTHELGIRLALGAQRKSVLALVVFQGMKMALGGLALGLIAALALTRFLTNMLYGVSPTDPKTFAAIVLLLTVVALLASLIPAHRATKVDPLTALRYE